MTDIIKWVIGLKKRQKMQGDSGCLFLLASSFWGVSNRYRDGMEKCCYANNSWFSYNISFYDF